MRRVLLALLFFLSCALVSLSFPNPARPRTDTTRREGIIKRALERKHWPRTPHAVRLSLIVGKYIAERRYGWRRGQWVALRQLWSHESGWRWWADNPYSSAYGIPQALPGEKMSSAGRDWRTNPVTQIRWGLSYIREVHHSPIGACGSDGCSAGTYRVEAA